jgi:hypothetical protein
MMPGCESLGEGNAKHLVQWASDNPNALVIVVSTFTFSRYVKDEIDAFTNGAELHNIVSSDDYDPIPQWFKDAHGIKGDSNA